MGINYVNEFMAERISERDKNALCSILQNTDGRVFIAHVFDICGLYKNRISNKSHMTMYHEGARQIALNTYQSLRYIARINPEVAHWLDIITTDNFATRISQHIYSMLRKHKKIKSALNYMLADRNGQWYLARLMESCMVYDYPYSDLEKTNQYYRYAGMRAIGLHIQQEIARYVPNGIQLLTEAIENHDTYKNNLMQSANQIYEN